MRSFVVIYTGYSIYSRKFILTTKPILFIYMRNANRTWFHSQFGPFWLTMPYPTHLKWLITLSKPEDGLDLQLSEVGSIRTQRKSILHFYFYFYSPYFYFTSTSTFKIFFTQYTEIFTLTYQMCILFSIEICICNEWRISSCSR